MSPRYRGKRRWYGPAGAGAAIVLLLAIHIDDWGRDFIRYEATLSAEAAEAILQPEGAGASSDWFTAKLRSSDELVEAVKMAAHRIRNWHYVGEAGHGNTIEILFVRTNRVLRTRDDITIRIEDLGRRRWISGESRSRLRLGDLGRNPRNLRRLLEELRGVLDGVARRPVMTGSYLMDYM